MAAAGGRDRQTAGLGRSGFPSDGRAERTLGQLGHLSHMGHPKLQLVHAFRAFGGQSSNKPAFPTSICGPWPRFDEFTCKYLHEMQACLE